MSEKQGNKKEIPSGLPKCLESRAVRRKYLGYTKMSEKQDNKEEKNHG